MREERHGFTREMSKKLLSCLLSSPSRQLTLALWPLYSNQIHRLMAWEGTIGGKFATVLRHNGSLAFQLVVFHDLLLAVLNVALEPLDV